jgi:hypothetical protein
MRKQQLDHVLHAAGRITGERLFIIIGSHALHGTHPDVADEILTSFEADLILDSGVDRTEWLNAIGVGSEFHESHGYYAVIVDIATVTLPNGWRSRLVDLPPGDTAGVRGLCLDPHDLAIAKYAAFRDEDLAFARELAHRGITAKRQLRRLLEETAVNQELRATIWRRIVADCQPVTPG